MSDTILNHGYVPEEHAPDPVVGHGDPLPPGRVAIWLFLASEVMFFIGLLATYIIFRSGNPKMFAEHAKVLSKGLAGINTLVLIFSSLTMALAVDAAQRGLLNRLRLMLLVTILCACGFMYIKYTEYRSKLTHHTIVTRDTADKKIYIYDGEIASRNGNELELEGHRGIVEPGPFDIHWMSPTSVIALQERAGGGSEEKTYKINTADISQDLTYGPWRNIFFASYFITTAIHALHVIGGIVALSLLLGHAMRRKILAPHTEYVGLYWHFVDLVWIFLFPLLYLI